ncbi:glycine cleavage system aminomethyltransferase GcvT [Sporosalibacterium faouarense]|uniref:glycine cleavage system aminomethyltransferase GcvT n=1 Tax=Sporosalibacterium faouarense TaxID=516123 RepID=UPI00141C82A3|nr:glycine cleavage system aminomethyltransferase GcvT [Sporosalibacterium faouarense]MTI49267.1 glycine cleavage system aminomethyltransferase GcvT [Bacillota bacterium]
MEGLKKTALFKCHEDQGGKIIDFQGWALPVQYEGIIPEHEAVREKAGIFDVSHMGEVEVVGEEASDFVQYLVTNDITVLEEQQVLYSFMCYEDGGVVDDLLVYKYSDKHYLLVINASNVEKDFNWIQKNGEQFDVEIKNISSEISEVALQGPMAQEILQQLTQEDLSEIKFFYFKEDIDIAGVKCIVSRTGYTGEDGFEIYTENNNITKIWEKIMDVGASKGLKPAGLGARDTLRFEATLPLYGNEISSEITPLEAGLGFFVKLNSDDFIGKEALVKQKEEGLKRKIVGFEMKKGIPRHGYEVYKGDEKIGFVTTGYFSPTLEKKIGLALIDIDQGQIGNQISIKVRNKMFDAEVISKRFYKKNYKK